MARQCPHNSKIKCGKKNFPDVCRTCDIRRSSGQKILTKEVKAEESIKTIIEHKIREFTCPYCLFTGLISKFYIPLKGGQVSEKRFKCLDCGEIMRRDTIFREQSVEEFAEWMFDTMAWQRVDFEKFKKRLKEMGISYQFWNHYKQYKEERMSTRTTGDKEYDEYMRDMQRQREEG